MERITKLIENRVARTALVLGLASAAIAGCGDTKGEGNNFVIQGKVLTVGSHSVEIYPAVKEADGKATGWFSTDNKTRVHNNYKGGLFCTLHFVGEEYDQAGNEENLDQVHPGEWVELDGRIRESNENCGQKTSKWESRPVYETLREIPGPQ